MTAAGRGAARLVWLLHVHKSGGSSVVELARRNGEALFPQHANGNPLDVDGTVLRPWEMTDAGLRRFVDRCVHEGVTFAATEWGFPDLEVLSTLPEVRTVIVLRDPVSRLLSNFTFDHLHGFTEQRSLAAYLDDHSDAWTMGNYLCRLLLGRDWRVDLTDEAKAAGAAERLALVDHVVRLEGPRPFAPLARALGWTHDDAHAQRGADGRRGRSALRQVRRGRLDLASRALRGTPDHPAEVLAEVQRRNAADLALLRHPAATPR